MIYPFRKGLRFHPESIVNILIRNLYDLELLLFTRMFELLIFKWVIHSPLTNEFPVTHSLLLLVVRFTRS